MHIFGPISGDTSVYFVLGPPGAGKTTLTLKLAPVLGAQPFHVSHFLKSLASNSPDKALGSLIKKAMSIGDNIDDVRFHNSLAREINMIQTGSCIIDGFPRTDGAMTFLLSDQNQIKFSRRFVVHVYASEFVCRERFEAKSYHNDSESVFENRISQYQKVERKIIRSLSKTMPIIEINTSNG